MAENRIKTVNEDLMSMVFFELHRSGELIAHCSDDIDGLPALCGKDNAVEDLLVIQYPDDGQQTTCAKCLSIMAARVGKRVIPRR